jgi:hypothetical protein
MSARQINMGAQILQSALICQDGERDPISVTDHKLTLSFLSGIIVNVNQGMK